MDCYRATQLTRSFYSRVHHVLEEYEQQTPESLGNRLSTSDIIRAFTCVILVFNLVTFFALYYGFMEYDDFQFKKIVSVLLPIFPFHAALEGILTGSILASMWRTSPTKKHPILSIILSGLGVIGYLLTLIIFGSLKDKDACVVSTSNCEGEICTASNWDGICQGFKISMVALAVLSLFHMIFEGFSILEYRRSIHKNREPEFMNLESEDLVY